MKRRWTDRVGNKLDLKQEYLKFEGIDSQLVGLCYQAFVRNIETKDYLGARSKSLSLQLVYLTRTLHGL